MEVNRSEMTVLTTLHLSERKGSSTFACAESVTVYTGSFANKLS